jgi:hypothetical protein
MAVLSRELRRKTVKFYLRLIVEDCRLGFFKDVSIASSFLDSLNSSSVNIILIADILHGPIDVMFIWTSEHEHKIVYAAKGYFSLLIYCFNLLGVKKMFQEFQSPWEVCIISIRDVIWLLK